MNKKNIFNEIENFFKKIENNEENLCKNISNKACQKFLYYVSSNIAKDRAKFIKFVLENFISKKFNNIIDLTFGSGNLTSHIVLDNGINFNKLVFNDIKKNKDRVNKKIADIYKNEGYENVEIFFRDILNSDSFSNEDKFDLIIFNPQIGGDYDEGEIKFETNAKIIINDIDIIDYIKQKTNLDIFNLDIKIYNDERKILIKSKLNVEGKPYYRKKDLNILRDTIYNYYDVYYESPGTQREGSTTNIVKFRRTLDKVSKNDTIIIFYGEKKNCELLFKDYKYLRYITNDDGSDVFILSKTFNENKCFKKIEDNFEEIDCEENFNSQEEKNYNLNELIKQVETNFKELSNISSIWSNDENDEKGSMIINKKDNKNKRYFKNFLKKCKGKK